MTNFSSKLEYCIVTAFTSTDLVDDVNKKLSLGREHHGQMTHVQFVKEVKFYQPMTKPYEISFDQSKVIKDTVQFKKQH